MKTIQKNRTDATKQYVYFKTTDAKGRKVGTHIYTWEVDFIEDAEAVCYYETQPGHYFVFEPHTTRDTLNYGALQSARYFSTADEREKAIEKYLTAAKKRANK